MPVKLVKINEIEDDLMYKKVKITGDVVKITNYKSGYQLLRIGDGSEEINVFIENGKSFDLKKSDKIIVTGKVQEYKNDIEIVAEKINKLNLG